MLLCNADNELIKLINDILNNKICLNINNTWQMIVLSIIIISVVVKFSKAFYASDIELFLSKGLQTGISPERTFSEKIIRHGNEFLAK